MVSDTEIKIYAGTSSVDFVDKMCRNLGVEKGKAEAMRFSDGNTFVRINEKVRDQDVYVVQTIGLDPNNEFMELLFWIDAFKRASAASVTAIVPYFSYAKGDKKDEPRVSIRARVCADCLESAGVDRIITMDLHSPQIQGFFKKPVDHLYAANIFNNHIRGMKLDNFVIVSPDEGFAKNARYYADTLGVPLAIGSKQRLAHDERAKVKSLVGSVEGKDAIVIDDFTASCVTLAEIARVLKENGANRVFAFVSHALMSPKSVEVLEKSYIEQLVVTDTVYNECVINHPRVQIVSAADMFATAIKIIHNKQSLGEMFEKS